MAGAGVLPQPVIRLADIIRLVYRLPFLAGKAVLPGSAYLLIAYLPGLPAGGVVDNAMEQVVEGAGVPLHDRRAAVNEFLHLLPVLRAYDGFMAALKHFPFLTWDDVIGIGADSLLVRPADQMESLIYTPVLFHGGKHRSGVSSVPYSTPSNSTASSEFLEA